jgi:hypothetical protein
MEVLPELSVGDGRLARDDVHLGNNGERSGR